jgi:hypothetical protein
MSDEASPSRQLHPSIAAIPMPQRIRSLPLDARGFPVPWFVALVNGEPDHRVVEGRRFQPALQKRLCWICGQVLGRNFAFLIGPMCAITRTISEPPSHLECCEYTVRACPFLSRPHAHRRQAGLPEDAQNAAGNGIKRNPGAVAIWITRSFRPFKVSNGLLFRMGDPTEVRWYAEGRKATADEVHASVYSGLPLLLAEASAEDDARRDLNRSAEYALAAQVAQAALLFPQASA